MPELLCVAAIALTLWLSEVRFGDIFTPMAVYVGVWCTAILLFLLRLINYNSLSNHTSLLIAGSIAAYVVGCLVCPRPRQQAGEVARFSQEHFDRALKSLIAVYLVGFLLFLLRMQSQFGLGTYLTDPGAIRGEADQWMKMGILGIPLFFHYPILILSFYGYLHTRRLRWFYIVGLTVPALQELFWTTRLGLAEFAVTLLFMWIYVRGWRRINRRLGVTAFFAAVIGVTGFLALGSVYGKLISEDQGVYKMSDFNVESSSMLLLAYPYMYVTSPFPTFQEAMADVHYHSDGTRTFYPAARLMAAIGILKEIPEWTIFDFYFVPVPSNVYTHLFAFYQDFGETGIFVIPFLLGIVHTWFYWRMRTAPSVWTIGAAAVSIVTVCFSIFALLASTLLIWECYLVLFVFWRFLAAVDRGIARNEVPIPKIGLSDGA